MIIKVLGPGCAKCKEAETLVNGVVAEKNSAATVEKVTDLQEMMRLGVMPIPAVQRGLSPGGRCPVQRLPGRSTLYVP